MVLDFKKLPTNPEALQYSVSEYIARSLVKGDNYQVGSNLVISTPAGV